MTPNVTPPSDPNDLCKTCNKPFADGEEIVYDNAGEYSYHKACAPAEAADAEPVEPKKLSRKEYKELMRKFFTVRRPTVQGCGHKIDPESEPKGNCETCWFAWFNTHGDLIKALVEMDQQHGPETIIRMRGLKFYKNWRKFMATVATLVAQMKKQEPSDSGNPQPTDPMPA